MKMKRKLLSVVLATFCSANTCVASMPIMAGAEEVTTGLSINASDLEIEGNDSDWYFSDETEWHFEGIKFYLNGEEIEPLECTFSYNGIKNVTPADVYDGKNFNYSIDISCEYDGQTAEATIPVKIGQRGDANCDHIANIRDAATIARDLAQLYSTKKTTLTAEDGFGIFLGNVDFEYGSGKGIVKDGKETEHYGIYAVDVRDAAAISKTVAQRLINETGGKVIERDTHDYASISLGETVAVPGETVTVPVNVTCNNNFESAAFLVEWEDSELNVSNAVGAGGTHVASEKYVNCVSVAAYNSVAVVDGKIATIDVTIPEDAVAGTEYKLNITKIETFAEFNGEDLADTVSVSGGTIYVSAERPDVAENMVMYEYESYEFSEDFDECEIVSTNNIVATVTNKVITAVSAGTAQIEYYINDYYIGTTNLTVKDVDEFEVGVNQQKFVFTPDFPYDNVGWEISNPTVAVIENGVLTGLSEGTTYITCRKYDEEGEVGYKGIVTVVNEAVVTTPFVETTTAVTTENNTTTTAVSTILIEVTNSVNSEGQIIGDANHDSIFNIRDAAFISIYCAQGDAGMLADCADYNRDGKLDIRDAATIAKAIANNQAYNRSETKLERNGSTSAKLSIGNAAGNAGGTISVPVKVECGNNFESGAFVIGWDSSELALSSFNTNYVNGSKVVGNGYCAFNKYDSSAVEDGEIATIEFIIPADAKIGDTYEIYFTDVETFAEFEGEDLADTVSVSSGTITVIPEIYKSINIYSEQTFELPADYNVFEITSEDSTIVTVENNTVTALSEGKTNINLEYKDVVYTIPVNVVPVKEMEINIYEEAEINLGLNDVAVKWTSSNTEVATVEYGVVCGVSRGTAIITAYDRETGEIVWEGTVNVKNGEKYGDYLYYKKGDSYVDGEQDGVYDYVEIIDCDETATSVHIPAEIEGLPVRYIDGFDNCTELAEITVDEEVTNIGSNTFENTAWFKKQKAENTFVVLNTVLLDGHNFEGETLEIPEDITVVGNSAFGGMENLKNVIVPENVVKVGIAGFGYCENLETITFENPDCEIPMPLGSMTPTEEITIRGYKGSTAQEFAEATGYSFALIGEDVVITTVTTSASTTTETTVTTTVSEDVTTSTEAETTTVSNTETTNIETTVTTTVTGEESVPFCGDANNDGDVSVRDCATIARLLAENKKDELPACADYNGDGVISVRDAAGISRAIATATLVKTPFVPAETTPAETTSVSVNTEVTTTTTTTTETTANEGWRVAYKDVMNNITAEDFSTEASHIKYTLYDADNDSVPELIVSGVDNSGTSLLNIYSWNETDGAYKIGDTLSYKNLVPGYYTDNGELGISTFTNYANYEAESFMVINIDGKTYNKESIGSTTTYHVEGMGEDTVCERGEEYFTELEIISLDGEVSVDEYFDNWTN